MDDSKAVSELWSTSFRGVCASCAPLRLLVSAVSLVLQVERFSLISNEGKTVLYVIFFNTT